jgi:subtilase family serine protease
MVRLQGSMPSLSSGVVVRGAVPRSQLLTIRVQLKMRDEAGANALALAVSTPGNALHGNYLTPDQFRARFAPTAASVAKVSSWLSKQGLKVTAVPVSRSYVEAQGSAAQIESVFKTSLVTVDTKRGQRRMNTTEPSIPGDLVASVDGITGLTQVMLQPTNSRSDIPGVGTADSAAVTVDAAGNAPPAAGFRVAPPCSAYWDQKDTSNAGPLLPAYGSGYPTVLPWAPCGYKPEQLRQAYGTSASVAGGTTGKGVTVAIVDAYASPTIVSDATTYAQRNDPSHPLGKGQLTQTNFRPFTNASLCGPSGWYGEETLDIEAVHAMAPGANIKFFGAKSCEDSDIDDAVAYVIDHKSADIVSNSYGNFGEAVPQAEINRTQRLLTQAAAEGIGFYFSSGDDGDESDNPDYTGPAPAADFPASSPWATAVGGTSLGVDANGHVAVEHGWDTGISSFDSSSNSWVPGGQGAFLYAAGGGPSRHFPQPDYQKGVVPNNIATGIGQPKRRVSPDVGMVGDPNTGFLIGITQTFPEGVHYDEYRLGGTSLSSPLFAGVMALADQKAGFHHGFANPFLYSLAGSAAFRDIKPGPKIGVVRRNFNNSVDASDGFGAPSVRTIDADLQSLRTLSGYDTLTGLGAPNGAAFLNAG